MNAKLIKTHLGAAFAIFCAVACAADRSLEPVKNEFKIVSPVPTGSTVEMITQAPRLDTLWGKTIALVGGSFSASVTHAVIRDMLVEESGCNIYFMEEIGKGGSYNPINPSAQTKEFQRFFGVGRDVYESPLCTQTGDRPQWDFCSRQRQGRRGDRHGQVRAADRCQPRPPTRQGVLPGWRVNPHPVMRIYFSGNSYPGRASLVTLKCKRHRDAAEAAYSKSDCWKWLLR